MKIEIHRTMILPVVWYGCETWLLTLREEYGLRVFENRELRRIFGPKRDKVMVGEKTTSCIPRQIYLGDQIEKNEWEDNIKMDIQEVGWVAWTRLIWLRIAIGGRLL